MLRVYISLLLLLSTTHIFSAEYVVIANKNMKDLSQMQIKAIFLKKLTIIDDTKMVPVSLGARDSLRENFEKNILKMNFQRLKSYWSKQHYLGHRPPLSMKSEESVKAFVKKVDGAIGYIEKSAIDNDIKILYEWKD